MIHIIIRNNITLLFIGFFFDFDKYNFNKYIVNNVNMNETHIKELLEFILINVFKYI